MSLMNNPKAISSRLTISLSMFLLLTATVVFQLQTEKLRLHLIEGIGSLDESVQELEEGLLSSEKRSSLNYNYNSPGKKPSLIIHVGPDKTGTTSLQKESKALTDVLARDSYAYLGLCNQRGSALQRTLMDKSCIAQLEEARQNHGQQTNYTQVPCWQKLQEELQDRYHRGENVILSDEGFSWNDKFSMVYQIPAFFEALQSTLGDEWSVLVVAAYRRYGEWALSNKKQLDGTHCLGPKAKWGSHCRETWPAIRKWMRKNPAMARDGNRYYVDTALQPWNDAGFETAILDFHAPGDLTTNFYCDILSDAPLTCQYLQDLDTSVKLNARSGSRSLYDRIAVEAELRGLINRDQMSKSRYDFVSELEDYHVNELGLSARDLPLICPDEGELEELLEKSLELEQQIMPTSAGETVHREAFWRLANEKKDFCLVDTDAIFTGKTSWEKVLASLKTRDWSIKIP